MTEYFTTSELAHARLAILHGFEGIDSSPIRNEWHEGFDRSFGEKWRFPRTPRNVALEAPVVGDVVRNQGGRIGKVRKDMFDRQNLVVLWCGGEVETSYAGETIIYRNNQPFPVWDKEK